MSSEFGVLYTATLITAKAVIPAPYQVRGKLQQESRRRPCEGREPYFRNWIPPYQVRGRLSQARNDKPYKTYIVMYSFKSLNSELRTHNFYFYVLVICVPIPTSVKISKRMACSTLPSMMWVFDTPSPRALRQQFTFGIIPEEMTF